MEALDGSTSVGIGFAVAMFSAVIGGIRRIDTRFNKLEGQMTIALEGRMTRQEHRIWVLEMRVRNPALIFPNIDDDA